MEDWAEIRRLHFSEGLGIKTIAKQLGLARNTVRAAVRSADPPKYERPARGSIVDPVEPEIRRLLADCPSMPATVIAERIGWERGMTVLKDRVRELRPLFLPPDPVQRTVYRPGELAQWDLWQPPVDIAVGPRQTARLWVLVGVAGFSRLIGARMIPTRAAHDVLGAMNHVLVNFVGGVPRRAVWDQEGCIGQWRKGRPQLTEAAEAFAGSLGMGFILCAPGDAEAKGLVERANGYLETSFLPGRTFEGIDDFNAQLTGWLINRANTRIHATTKTRPAEAIFEDRGAMLGLPAVMPDVSWCHQVRLGRDHFVRFDTNDYSVNPRFIGRRVDVTVGLDEIVVACDGTEIARHRRCLASGQTILAAEHARVVAQLRNERAAMTRADDGDAVEIRDLGDYDRILGVAS